MLKKKKIGQLLCEKSYLDEAGLDHALGQQRNKYQQLGQILLELGYVTQAGLNESLALQVGIQRIDLSEIAINSAIISLAAPIYKVGRLKAGVKAAKARAEQSAARYADVVLRAIREVEDALVTEQQTRKQVTLVKERFDESMIADKLARQRYSQGLETLLIVLETERRRIIAENELALVTENLYNARIDLFLALGGDWEMPLAADSR